MELKFKIPDELFEAYVVKWGLPGAYKVMRDALETYKVVERNDRYVFIAGDDRRAIEEIFKTTIDDSKKLVRLVKNMNSVKIEGVEVNFSDDELLRIDAQAGFHGRDRETYVREMIRELLDRMLENV